MLDEAHHHDVTGEATARTSDKSLKANKFKVKGKY